MGGRYPWNTHAVPRIHHQQARSTAIQPKLSRNGVVCLLELQNITKRVDVSPLLPYCVYFVYIEIEKCSDGNGKITEQSMSVCSGQTGSTFDQTTLCFGD